MMRIGMLFLLCFVYVSSAAAKVHKWVDENGVTHYSENKPEGTKTTEIKVKGFLNDGDETSVTQGNNAASELNCERAVLHGINLLKNKIKNSGTGPSPFNAMINDPDFIKEGVDECLTEKSDPVKAAQWLCQQKAKTFNAVQACEK